MLRKFALVCVSGLLPLTAQAALNVFACEPEWAQLTTELGGEHVQVHSATTAFQDPHYIQARPSLISKVRRADLLVCTGAELEIGWLPVLLERAANPKVQLGAVGNLMAADHIELLEKLDRVDSSMGHVHAAGNPHFQTDPQRTLAVAKVLSDRLITLDPSNSQFYQKKWVTFEKNFKENLKRWAEESQSLKGLNVVVHHNSWIYMNNWLGLNQVATLEPKPGVPPSTSHLNYLLEMTNQSQPDVIVYAAYQDPQGAQWLSSRTNIPLIKIHSTVLPDESMVDFYRRLITYFIGLKN